MSQVYDHRVRRRRDEGSQAISSPWSSWGVRLITLVSVALAICLGWDWIQAFYRTVAVNAQLSFPAGDQPWMPLDSVARPIIGNHYFGDFQLPLGYASNLRHALSPYLSSAIPENYPPFTSIVFVLFSFLPLKVSAGVYLVLSAAIFLVPLWLLLAPLKVEYRVIFLIPLAILTVPFISFLDRGNDIGIAMGLVAWALWAWRSERWVLCGAFAAAAIAFKGYPAAILIVPLALRRYRFTAFVAGSAVILNLLSLLAFPGGYLKNLRAVPSAMISYKLNGGATQLASWSLFSLIPKTAGLLVGPSAAHGLLTPNRALLWLPSVLYLVGVYFLIRRRRVPQWCWGPLALASIQLIVPLSFAYATAWAPLSAIWFAWGHLIEDPVDEPDRRGPGILLALRILVLMGLIASLVPSTFTLPGPDGFTTPLTEYLSPLFMFASLCVATAYSFLPSPSEAPPAFPEDHAILAEPSVALTI
jgi:hypothetical protein